MLRGIDPEGLSRLASEIVSPRQLATSVVEVLSRNGRSGDATAVANTTARIDNWAQLTGDTIRWRVETIVAGQTTGSSDLVRSRFAATAIVCLDTLEESYRRWLEAHRKSCVERAIADVSRWLDQGWTDWDVTNSDLHNIQTALAELNSDELEQVITRLTATQLGRWIEEMGNRFNGFSRSEKQEVFALLAGSGDAITRVHDAIVTAGSSADAIDFGTAVSQVAADDAIARFVSNVLAADLETTPLTTVALAIGGIDESAIVNEVIGEIVESDATELLVADALGLTDDPLVSLGRALRRVTNPAVAAAAFSTIVPLATDPATRHRLVTRNAGAERIRSASMALSRAKPDLLELAEDLILRNGEPFIRLLATDTDPSGALMTDLIFERVDAGASETIGTIAGTLRGGPQVDPDQFAVLGEYPDYRYPHAQNLAYFAACLNNALARYASDAKDDINLITAAAAAANLLVAPLFTALATGVPTALVEAGVGYGYANMVQQDINSSLMATQNVVTASLQPSVTVDGVPHELGESALWWDQRYRIVRGVG